MILLITAKNATLLASELSGDVQVGGWECYQCMLVVTTWMISAGPTPPTSMSRQHNFFSICIRRGPRDATCLIVRPEHEGLRERHISTRHRHVLQALVRSAAFNLRHSPAFWRSGGRGPSEGKSLSGMSDICPLFSTSFRRFLRALSEERAELE